MKVGPQLWNGKLAWMLGEEVLQDDVEGSAGNAEKIAAQGLKVRDNGAAFSPLFLLLEVDDAIGDREIFSEAPFVTCAEAGGDSVCQVFVDI